MSAEKQSVSVKNDEANDMCGRRDQELRYKFKLVSWPSEQSRNRCNYLLVHCQMETIFRERYAKLATVKTTAIKLKENLDDQLSFLALEEANNAELKVMGCFIPLKVLKTPSIQEINDACLPKW